MSKDNKRCIAKIAIISPEFPPYGFGGYDRTTMSSLVC